MIRTTALPAPITTATIVTKAPIKNPITASITQTTNSSINMIASLTERLHFNQTTKSSNDKIASLRERLLFSYASKTPGLEDAIASASYHDISNRMNYLGRAITTVHESGADGAQASEAREICTQLPTDSTTPLNKDPIIAARGRLFVNNLLQRKTTMNINHYAYGLSLGHTLDAGIYDESQVACFREVGNIRLMLPEEDQRLSQIP